MPIRYGAATPTLRLGSEAVLKAYLGDAVLLGAQAFVQQFATTIEGWSTRTNGTALAHDPAVDSGSITWTTTGATGTTAVRSNFQRPVTAGESITLSITVRHSHSSALSGRINVEEYDAAGESLGAKIVPSPDASVQVGSTLTNVAGTYTASTVGVAKIELSPHFFNVPTGVQFWIGGVTTDAGSAPATVPGDYAPAYEWGYEAGLLAKWASVHGTAPALVSSGRSDFATAAEFTLNDTTAAPWDVRSWNDGIPVRRTEMSDGSVEHAGFIAEGVEQYWAWSVNFSGPYNPPTSTFSRWLVHGFQLHHSGGSGQPPVWWSLDTAGRPVLIVGPSSARQTFALGDAYTAGTWTDWAVYFKHSSNPANGRASVWRNGVQVLNNVACATFYAGDAGTYPKQGMYGNRYSGVQGSTTPEPQMVMRALPLRRGTSLASVTKAV